MSFLSVFCASVILIAQYGIIKPMNELFGKTYRYLLSCGFSPVHKGFKLIIDAVTVLCDERCRITMSQLYGRLAKKHDISPHSVQKNIKNAIDFASLNCDIDFFASEFGPLAKGCGLPCGAFLCYVADRMQYG